MLHMIFSMAETGANSPDIYRFEAILENVLYLFHCVEVDGLPNLTN